MNMSGALSISRCICSVMADREVMKQELSTKRHEIALKIEVDVVSTPAQNRQTSDGTERPVRSAVSQKLKHVRYRMRRRCVLPAEDSMSWQNIFRDG